MASQRSRSRLSFALLVAAVLAPPPVAVAASDDSGVLSSNVAREVYLSGVSVGAAPDTALANASDSMLMDAQKIADKMGWDVAYAVERLQHQDRFGQLLVVLDKEYPDTFGGGYTVNGEDATSWVRFKGAVPEAAVRRASEMGVEAAFLGGAELSQFEFQELADRLNRDLVALGSTNPSTGFSIQDQRVQATANPPAGLEDRSSQDLQSMLPPYARDDNVTVDFVQGPLATPAHAYGGDRLLDDGAFECTSGFTVTSGVARGVLTAGHCSGLNQYKQADGLVFGMQFQNQHMGQWGDFEWHTTTHDEFPNFYAAVGNLRPVATLRPAGAIAEGDFYCGFGRSSNNSVCSTVRIVSQACGGLNRLTVMQDGVGLALGDSGGPWYISNTAVGIFYGWCVIDFARFAFSKADYSDDALGVTVNLQ